MVQSRQRVSMGGVESYRAPRSDELSVMRAFSGHVSHCPQCQDPCQAMRYGSSLCKRGYGFVKDIGDYFFCSKGRPYSVIEQKSFGQRVQVEVPKEHDVVRNLFVALSQGFNPKPKRDTLKPQVHHDLKFDTKDRTTQVTTTAVPEEYVTEYPTVTPNNSSHRHRDHEKYREEKRSRDRRGSLYHREDARRQSYRQEPEVIIIPESHKTSRYYR